MKKYYEDREYLSKVNDILDNEEFQKLGDIIHHEGNRYEHSVRVSYNAYKLAKVLHLDTEKVARGALLHDFYLEKNKCDTKKEKMGLLIKHPEYALENSKKYFDLSPLEEDIILTHMFPIGKRVPRYLESWMVDIIDDFAALYEKTTIIRKQLSTASCFLVMILVNNLR